MPAEKGIARWGLITMSFMPQIARAEPPKNRPGEAAMEMKVHAEAAYRAHEDAYEAGTAEFDAIYKWSVNLMKAERLLAAKSLLRKRVVGCWCGIVGGGETTK